MQPRLRWTAADTARAHDQFTRVQPESAQTENPSAEGTDVIGPELRISVCQRCFHAGIKNAQFPPVQDSEAARSKRDFRHAVQQGMSNSRCAGGPANDGNARRPPQSGKTSSNRPETFDAHHITRTAIVFLHNARPSWPRPPPHAEGVLSAARRRWRALHCGNGSCTRVHHSNF